MCGTLEGNSLDHSVAGVHLERARCRWSPAIGSIDSTASPSAIVALVSTDEGACRRQSRVSFCDAGGLSVAWRG